MSYREKFLKKFNEGRNPDAYRNDGTPAFPGDRGAGSGRRSRTSHEIQHDIADHGIGQVNRIIKKAQEKIEARRKKLDRQSRQ